MAFKLENIFFGLFIFILFFTVGMNLYTEGLGTYGVAGDNSSFGKVSNVMKQTYDANIIDMKTKIQGNAVSNSDAVNNMVAGGYTAVRNNPFSAATNVLNITSVIITESGLIDSALFNWVIIALLTTAVAFAIVYLIMRFRVY